MENKKKAWTTKNSVCVGGEFFDENHYIANGKEHSFVVGCFGTRYVMACLRENVLPDLIILTPNDHE